jgi:hypothetical protein
MLTYTRCRSCSGPLLVTDDDQDMWHPTCPPRPTELEKLTADYLYTVEHHGEEAAQGYEAKLWDMQCQPPNLKDAALYYATHYGWPVFPLKPKGKAPLTKNGFKDATTDVNLINLWWCSWPHANVGIPTGIHFDVIDVDPPRGWESWHGIQKLVLPDVHARVATASGGAHFYVTPTGSGNRAGIYPGIDYRGVGGYVVAPPSWLGEHRYSWTFGIHPSPFIIPTLKGVVDGWYSNNLG